MNEAGKPSERACDDVPVERLGSLMLVEVSAYFWYVMLEKMKK
jgi:hypothetical protein